MADENPPSTRVLSRSRGAASGILLVLLGAWGALAPFIGPTFTFAFTPDKAWHWTAARGWYEVAPGVAAFVGGLLLLFARSRAVTVLGAWLGILAGAWFIIGPAISSELTLGTLGQPIGSSSGQRLAETLTFFYGLGVVILYLAAAAFGRLSVVTVRDLRIAERREAERREREGGEDDGFAQGGFGRERYDGDDTDGDPDDTGYTYNRYAEPGATGATGATGDATAASTREYPAADTSARDTHVFDQHASDRPAQPEQPSGDAGATGFHSALGYRQGEHQSEYSAPTYGRHDANLRGTTTNTRETQGPPVAGGAADTTTQEQPR